MRQYSVGCPQCAFVVRFHDSALLGRTGQCPKCHHKFILIERAEPEPPAPDTPQEATERSHGPMNLSAETRDRRQSSADPVKTKTLGVRKDISAVAVPASKDAASVPPAVTPPARKPAPVARKVREPRWETEVSRGFPPGQQSLPMRWVFPDPLAATTVAVIGLGAAMAAGAADLLFPSNSGLVLGLWSTLGGAVAAGCLVRRRRR